MVRNRNSTLDILKLFASYMVVFIHLGSLFILLAVVVTFIKFPNTKYPSALLSLADCSTYIYIFHPLVISLMYIIYPKFPINWESPVFQMLHPLMVCVFSTLIAYTFHKLLKRRKG